MRAEPTHQLDMAEAEDRVGLPSEAWMSAALGASMLIGGVTPNILTST